MKTIKNEHQQKAAAPHTTDDFEQLRNDPLMQELQSIWDSHSRRIEHIVANAAPLSSRVAFSVPEPFPRKAHRYAAAILLLLSASATPVLASRIQNSETYIKSNNIDNDTLSKNIQWTIEHIQ